MERRSHEYSSKPTKRCPWPVCVPPSARGDPPPGPEQHSAQRPLLQARALLHIAKPTPGAHRCCWAALLAGPADPWRRGEWQCLLGCWSSLPPAPGLPDCLRRTRDARTRRRTGLLRRRTEHAPQPLPSVPQPSCIILPLPPLSRSSLSCRAAARPSDAPRALRRPPGTLNLIPARAL